MGNRQSRANERENDHSLNYRPNILIPRYWVVDHTTFTFPSIIAEERNIRFARDKNRIGKKWRKKKQQQHKNRKLNNSKQHTESKRQSCVVENLCNETWKWNKANINSTVSIRVAFNRSVVCVCVCAGTLAGASVRANRHPPPFWRERTRKIDTNESAYNLQSVLFYVIDITSDDSFNLILFSLCCRFSRLLPAGSTLFQFAI